MDLVEEEGKHGEDADDVEELLVPHLAHHLQPALLLAIPIPIITVTVTLTDTFPMATCVTVSGRYYRYCYSH